MGDAVCRATAQGLAAWSHRAGGLAIFTPVHKIPNEVLRTADRGEEFVRRLHSPAITVNILDRYRRSARRVVRLTGLTGAK